MAQTSEEGWRKHEQCKTTANLPRFWGLLRCILDRRLADYRAAVAVQPWSLDTPRQGGGDSERLLEEVLAAAGQEPDGLVVEADKDERLRRWVDEVSPVLNETEQLLIILTYYEEMKPRQIQDETGMDARTVSTLLSRAKGKLQKAVMGMPLDERNALLDLVGLGRCSEGGQTDERCNETSDAAIPTSVAQTVTAPEREESGWIR